MINIGLALLIVVSIFLTIIVLALIVTAGASVINENKDGKTGGTLPYCDDVYENSQLIQIPPNHPSCYQNGIKTEFYYIGNIAGNDKYDYVVAPWSTQPTDVCIGYCSEFDRNTQTCTGNQYNGVSAQQNYDRCMEQLNVTTCIPPIPIASRTAVNAPLTIYYAFSPTCNICDGCGS